MWVVGVVVGEGNHHEPVVKCAQVRYQQQEVLFGCWWPHHLVVVARADPLEQALLTRAYALRWSSAKGVEGQQLRRTSIQLFGIFVEARLDFMKKGGRLEKIVTLVQSSLHDEIVSNPDFTNICSCSLALSNTSNTLFKAGIFK